MRRRILASAAAASLMFGLVACGDNGGNGTVTTPPPDISVEGSDGGGNEPSDGGSDDGSDVGASDGGGDSPTAAPDIPAPDTADYPGMDQNTPEGAEQAFRYYVAVAYWGHASGDETRLAKLHTDTCGSCATLESQITSLRDNDQLWSQPEIELVWIDSHESTSFDQEISYGFTFGPHTRPAEPNHPTSDTETKMTAIAGLDWTGTNWEVGGMEIGESESH